MDEGTGAKGSLSRRALIRRGAIIGGVVWAAPVVQSLTNPAFATGSRVHHDPCTAMFFVKYQLPTSQHRFGVWSGSDGSGRWSCRPPSYDAAVKPRFTGRGHSKAAGGVLLSWAEVGGAGAVTAVYDPKTHCLTITPPGNCTLFQVLVKQGGHCVSVPLSAPYPKFHQFFSGKRGAALSYVSLVLCCS